MIKQILTKLKHKLVGHRYRIVNAELGGVPLRVYEGTIRLKADADDAWFVSLAKESPIIYDIGANIGYTGLLANVYAHPKEMILVDPNPLALACAADNLIMNNLSGNCRFLSAFVANEIGIDVKFYSVGRGAAGSIYPEHAKSAASLGSWYWVQTVTIDELVRRYNLIPHLVKIDVEGAEESVLKGAMETVKHGKTFFIVEMHSNTTLTMEANANSVLEWCKKTAYTAWYLKESILLTNAQQIAHRGRCHLLLIPKSSSYPAALQSIPQGSALPRA